jgi:hypothetical protein
MSFIKLDSEIMKKKFFTIGESDVTSFDNHAVISLKDESGSWTEIYVFKNEEDAGQCARDYWEDYIDGETSEEIVAILGADTLIAWALGREAGPGSSKVKNLNEWLDLYYDAPEEHFDSGPYQIELVAENIEEIIGFKPTVAYGM